MAKYISNLDFNITLHLEGIEFPYEFESEHEKERKEYEVFLSKEKIRLLNLLKDNGFAVGDKQVSSSHPYLISSNQDEQREMERSAELEAEKEEVREEFIEKIATENNIDVSLFALGNDVDLYEIIDDGEVIFTYKGGWGVPWSSKVFVNPTFLDAWKASNEAIKMSGDGHHVFFESVEFKEVKGSTKYYELSFGS